MRGAVVETMVGARSTRLRTLRWEAPEPRGRVVIVHGMGEHAGRYGHVARAFAERGYGVLAYDLRGHGASEGRRGHIADFDLFVDDLHRAREEAELRVPGPGAPFLVGHSLGGLVLLRYLQTWRPSTPGAVLSAPWLALAHPVPRWKRLLGAALERLAPELPVREPLPPEALTRDEALQRDRADDPLVHAFITAGAFQRIREAQSRALDSGVEPSIPALVLLPGDDRVARTPVTRAWATGVAGDSVEVMELPEGRHEPFNDLEREALLARVADWFDARLQRRAEGEPGAGVRVSPPPDAQ